MKTNNTPVTIESVTVTGRTRYVSQDFIKPGYRQGYRYVQVKDGKGKSAIRADRYVDTTVTTTDGVSYVVRKSVACFVSGEGDAAEVTSATVCVHGMELQASARDIPQAVVEALTASLVRTKACGWLLRSAVDGLRRYYKPVKKTA